MMSGMQMILGFTTLWLLAGRFRNNQCQVEKKAKVRLTILVWSNATGTEKMPLMIIRQAYRPRVFRGKTGQELGFDYWNSKKV